METSKVLRKTCSMSELTHDEVDKDFYVPFHHSRHVSSLDNVSEAMKTLKRLIKREIIREKMTMAERLKQAAPYNIFFNCLENVPETYKQPNSIQFCDLLCPSLGKLKCVLYFCFLFDVDWMISSFRRMGLSDMPLTIIWCGPTLLSDISNLHPNITIKNIKIEDAMGNHNTKMAIYVYEDESVRISVGSVNPFYDDWNCLHHGIWVSPRCPKLDDSRHDVQGESPTGFKKSILEYLRYYKEDCLIPYIDYIRRANFCEIKVFFIYSVPGLYELRRSFKSGCHIHQVENVLSRFCTIPDKDPTSWKIITQCSSVGFLGCRKNEDKNYFEHLLNALSKHNNEQSTRILPEMNIIYPSAKNVLDAFLVMGERLIYDGNIYRNQKWMNKYFLQWKSDAYNRSKVVPRITSYFRISPCSKKLAYFLLTSANLTRSGWGAPSIRRSRSYRNQLDSNTEIDIFMRSYEAGVLFIPKFFDEQYFEVCSDAKPTKKTFPFLLNLPLVPYEDDSVPWITRPSQS